jgi:uncharacterized protein YggE
MAIIVATAGASLAGTIETTGVGTASIEPDRIFIELEVGVKGGSAYVNETVTKSDLTRVLTLIDLAGISQSDILSAGIVNPGDAYASNPIIDERSFGSIIIKLEAPTTIAREHVETALRRGVEGQSIRDGIYIDYGPEIFGLDDCDGAKAKARALAIDYAKSGAARLESSLSLVTGPPILATQRDNTDFLSERSATGYVCGKSALPPIYPSQDRSQSGAFGLPKDVPVRVVEKTQWSVDFANLTAISVPPPGLNSNQFYIPQDADPEAKLGTIRASAQVYDDAHVDGVTSRPLELALDRAQAQRLAQDAGVELTGLDTIADPAEVDPTFVKMPRFFDHDGTSLTASFRISGAPTPKGATLDVIGVSDEELAADRAQAAIILHAPPTGDLATALSTLVARARGTVTFENRGDGRTAVTATIAVPTASSIDELRTGFAALPGIDPNGDHIWMSYALEDCFKAQRRELDRAVSAAHTIAIDRAKALGVRILGVAGAASLGSDVTINSHCGPNALARLGPIPYDDRAPATVREAARVAIRYAVSASSP